MPQIPDLPAEQHAEADRQLRASRGHRWWAGHNQLRDGAHFFHHVGNVCARLGLLMRISKCVPTPSCCRRRCRPVC